MIDGLKVNTSKYLNQTFINKYCIEILTLHFVSIRKLNKIQFWEFEQKTLQFKD
jgi:hypothetical protein